MILHFLLANVIICTKGAFEVNGMEEAIFAVTILIILGIGIIFAILGLFLFNSTDKWKHFL